MHERRFLIVMRLFLIFAVSWGTGQFIRAQSGSAQDQQPMKRVTPEMRKAAAVSAAALREAQAAQSNAPIAAQSVGTAATARAQGRAVSTQSAAGPESSRPSRTSTSSTSVTTNNVTQVGALGSVDYFGGLIPNFANSKLPTLTQTSAVGVFPVTYSVTPGTGIRKFVNTLPGLGPLNKNNINQFIPIAVPFSTSTKPAGVPNDGDYFEIGLFDYTQQFHSDLPTTTQFRGYADLNPTAVATNPVFAGDNLPHYLGPLIIARRNVPTRVKFYNKLDPNSSLFIPIDTTYMGAGMGTNGAGTVTAQFSQNRANLHLHGGNTPWISDGTPHQWITPAGDSSPVDFKQGVSVYNVPDMPQPTKGDGTATFFWTNQQSARLMFYHDHAYGITRLNVYAGEAAGFLVHDDQEDALIANGTIPNNGGGVYNWGIPLIIQDKTFVPPAAQLAAEDPTWNWGAEGNFWFPHVYMPNQAPDNPDGSGANPMGRWDYGPWFWPPMTASNLAHGSIPCGTGSTLAAPAGWPTGAQCPGTPNPSGVPESFMDTPMVNGTPYPYTTLPQGVYRFRMLNAANDRMFNFSWFYAADKDGNVCNPNYVGFNNLGVPSVAPTNPALCTEVKMVAAVPHSLVLPLPAPELPADADDQLPACARTDLIPDVISYGTTINGLPVGTSGLSVAYPLAIDYNPATGLPGLTRPCWPSSWPTDGRDGGVPDPGTAGPPWIMIGTEGGFLPKPVVIPATPVGFNYNRRDIVVLNIQNRGLELGPAERADVIVDLRNAPIGSTLMLYNDCPAPVPAGDPRLDYYTGDPDQTDTGGAPTTQPGYGPNTRTIMAIRIAAAASADTTDYIAALNTALPTYWTTTVSTTSTELNQPKPIVPETTYGTAIPTPPAADTYVRIQDNFASFNPESAAGLPTVFPLGSKAIHELFDIDYGRMNSLLGTELPLTSWLNQTTIPLTYFDPPTEILNDGQIQLWKITHNGVDTHAVHFHLVNVQLINRVGWDGAIRPPDPNELGWKETIRMNPLEDAIIAMKPMKQNLPFPIGESTRLLDPTRAQGATNLAGDPGFTNIDPNTNNPITVVNNPTNFGWEYVWHCHLLGHEENDMMRPLVFKVAVPNGPTNLTATVQSSTSVRLNWAYTQGTTLATGLYVERSVNFGNWVKLAAASNLAVTTLTFTDTGLTAGNVYSYRVIAFNATALSAASNVQTIALILAPTNLRLSSQGIGYAIVAWNNPNPAGVATGFTLSRCTGSSAACALPTATWTTIVTTPATILNYRNTGLVTGTTYQYRVVTNGPAGAVSGFSNVLQVIKN